MSTRSGEDSGEPRGKSAMIKRVLGFGFMACAGLGGFFIFAAARADAQTETMLHSFGSQPGDRANPHGGLLYSKGNLYGTTDFNAPSGNLGIVFEITAGGKYTILYNFGGQSGDGTAPCDFGGLAFRAGKHERASGAEAGTHCRHLSGTSRTRALPENRANLAAAHFYFAGCG